MAALGTEGDPAPARDPSAETDRSTRTSSTHAIASAATNGSLTDAYFADSLERAGSDAHADSPKALHARMNMEVRDEPWATEAEHALQDFIVQQPFQAAFGTAEVECRSTVCRVAVLADQTVLSATPQAEWHVITANLRQSSVWQEFGSSSDLVVINKQYPGRVGFMTFFIRN